MLNAIDSALNCVRFLKIIWNFTKMICIRMDESGDITPN